jgi:hypothetical protein
MSTKLNLEALFEGMDKTILNEENQKKLEKVGNLNYLNLNAYVKNTCCTLILTA